MKKAISAVLAKKIDKYSCDNNMAGIVLMERASLEVASFINNLLIQKGDLKRAHKIAVVCSVGNNGADGIAAARILCSMGCYCDIYIMDSLERATKEFLTQLEVIKHYSNHSLRFIETDILQNVFGEYTVIVDAIFGVGLSRNIEGRYKNIFDAINESKKLVVSVDIASGIDSGNGNICGVAVHADYTVTFGYAKVGQLLYPGKEYTGTLIIADIGLLPDVDAFFEDKSEWVYYYDDLVAGKRKKRTNKGDYGKPLIIAGSRDMTGAAFMSGLAAYRTGAGVVTVLSHENSDIYLKSILPEAIVKSYNDENAYEVVKELMERHTAIAIGPGLSTCDTSRQLVKAVLENAKVPVIIDADGLNIISEDCSVLANTKAEIIITPHVGEMARLTKLPSGQIIEDIVKTAQEFAKKYGVTVVLKDAVTAVCSKEGRRFVTTAGNPGMAGAGSGDVLVGVLASLVARKHDDLFEQVCFGTQLHALAGDKAADKMGEHAMMARDIIDGIVEVIR